MALGEKLRSARIARKQSTSDVATATQMSVHVVEALEREDFSRISAPIYAKGFIRLYARHVGVDPEPLVGEYVSVFAGRDTTPVISDVELDVHRIPPSNVASPVDTNTHQEHDGQQISSGATPSNHAIVDDDDLRPSIIGAAAGVCRRAAQAVGGGLARIAGTLAKKPSGDSSRNNRNSALDERTWSGLILRYLPMLLALLVVVIFLASSFSSCSKKPSVDTTRGNTRDTPSVPLRSPPPEPFAN